jgi:excisionase family DNA binding protein
METYLTVEELAVYFKLTAQTVRRWILNNEVPFHKVNHSVRFRLSEIEKWVGNNELVKKAKETEPSEGDLFAKLETPEQAWGRYDD